VSEADADVIRILLAAIGFALLFGAGRGRTSFRPPYRSNRELMGLPPRKRK
jgi:hypothetical protein